MYLLSSSWYFCFLRYHWWKLRCGQQVHSIQGFTYFFSRFCPDINLRYCKLIYQLILYYGIFSVLWIPQLCQGGRRHGDETNVCLAQRLPRTRSTPAYGCMRTVETMQASCITAFLAHSPPVNQTPSRQPGTTCWAGLPVPTSNFWHHLFLQYCLNSCMLFMILSNVV